MWHNDGDDFSPAACFCAAAGFFFLMPPASRAAVFIDGQNLYYSAKRQFGYAVPNYDVCKLARAVCGRQGWQPEEINFYTGVPEAGDNPRWHGFWNARLRAMRESRVNVFSRPLRNGKEKGVDVRIALDVIRAVLEGKCEVAVIFSQDQDLSEVAEEVRRIARHENRRIRIASAYPEGEGCRVRGINKTDWLPIDRELYDRCLDSRNYFPAFSR